MNYKYEFYDSHVFNIDGKHKDTNDIYMILMDLI